MGRGPQPFKQKDGTRLLKAARNADFKNPVLRLNRDGSMVVYDDVAPSPSDKTETSLKDTWSDDAS